MIRKKFKNKKAEAYVDLCLGILILMIVLVFAINVFQFFVIRQELNEVCNQLLETATFEGCFGDKFNERAEKLKTEVYDFEIEVSAEDYYNESLGRVQLGHIMEVKVSKDTYLQAVGALKIPMRVSTHKSGISERYWKEEVDDIEYEDIETDEDIVLPTP